MSTTTKTSKTKQPTAKVEVSAEQESHRMLEARELLQRLQVLLTEGEAPGIEILSDALQKAEELSLQAAHHPDMDPATQKTLEDISALLLSARQLDRNKGIADRLQKIYEESAKALEASRGAGVPAATKEATENILGFNSNWRPLFHLLTSSRDFRQLILDTTRIVKRVVYGYSEDITEETKQKFVEGAPVEEIAKVVKERTQQKEVPEMTDEEWNTLQDDIQRVLVLLSEEPAYQEGTNRIFLLLDWFQKSITQEPPVTVVPEEMHIRRVVAETEDLVASFSGRETLERFKYHLRNLITQIQRNENVRNYLNELKEFILKTKSKEEIRSEDFKIRSKELAYQGRDLMREFREQEDLRPFLEAADDMIENFKNDEFLQLLRHHAGIVQSDLSYVDTQGKLQVDTDMLSKLQTVLLPVLADAMKYIPLPRIESKDSDREFWLDNVVLCSYDIIPEHIRFHLESDSEVSVRDIEVKGTNTHLVIQLDHLLTELKDVEFYYKKKKFPSFEEHGKVNFRIKGKGAKLTFTYSVVQDPQDEVPRIREGDASFDISDMSIDFDTSTLEHPVMVPMLTTMFKTKIRQQIERQVEHNLTGFVEKLGDMITNSLSQINRPFLSGIEAARKAVKSTQMAQLYEKRREKLE